MRLRFITTSFASIKVQHVQQLRIQFDGATRLAGQKAPEPAKAELYHLNSVECPRGTPSVPASLVAGSHEEDTFGDLDLQSVGIFGEEPVEGAKLIAVSRWILLAECLPLMQRLKEDLPLQDLSAGCRQLVICGPWRRPLREVRALASDLLGSLQHRFRGTSSPGYRAASCLDLDGLNTAGVTLKVEVDEVRAPGDAFAKSQPPACTFSVEAHDQAVRRLGGRLKMRDDGCQAEPAQDTLIGQAYLAACRNPANPLAGQAEWY